MATDMRSLIVETANELGMNPVTLATIISYETAGTFNPRKKGPTTKWGQHEGLIQFGQPQQKEYGVDLSSEEAAIRSQLGKDGAVVKYFRRNGWQPGMGELDAYSIVNAGAPGRYNASDTAAGGAPGTVRDKVETQFAGHRQKATALLGGEFAPETGTAYASGTPAPGATSPTDSKKNIDTEMAAKPEEPDYSMKPLYADVNMFNAPVQRQRQQFVYNGNMLGTNNG